MTKISTLRPGLLVSLKTSMRGNVSYEKRDLDEGRDGNTEIKKWETERTIADAKEYELAKKMRGAATLPIRKVCTWSAFGLLCPEADREDLDAAIAESERIVADFNAQAELTRIHCYVLVAKVAADDVQAVKAINSEIRDLMADMESGLKNLDVKQIRDAANKAKSIGQMLTPEAEGRVVKAVEVARQAARNITKAGEDAILEVDKRAIRKIAEQRTTFLDLDDAAEIQKPKARTRRVDIDVEA